MIKAGEPVTFRGLAARAGVSLDFLYRNTAIRTRIEHHRSAQPRLVPLIALHLDLQLRQRQGGSDRGMAVLPRALAGPGAGSLAASMHLAESPAYAARATSANQPCAVV
jgi:hypothetical protein